MIVMESESNAQFGYVWNTGATKRFPPSYIASLKVVVLPVRFTEAMVERPKPKAKPEKVPPKKAPLQTEWFANFRLDRFVCFDGCRVKIVGVGPLVAGEKFMVRYQRINSHGRPSGLVNRTSVDPEDALARKRWDFSGEC